MDDPSSFADPNDELLQHMLVAVERFVDGGMERDEALTHATKQMTKVLDETANNSALAYEATGLKHVTDLHDYRAGFEERLLEYWGDALDLYLVVVEIIHQASQHFSHRHSDAVGDQAALLAGSAKPAQRPGVASRP